MPVKLNLNRSNLRASSPGRSACRAETERRACNYISGIWIPPPILLWVPVDWVVRFSPISTNVNKHWKTRVKGNDIISNVIFAKQHFASTFSIQIFKFQRCSCKFSFLFPPRHQSTKESLLLGQNTFRGASVLLKVPNTKKQMKIRSPIIIIDICCNE